MMLQFWTYMVRCNDGSYYVGHTEDLERRIAEHNAGLIGGYTFERRPVQPAQGERVPSTCSGQAFTAGMSIPAPRVFVPSRLRFWNQAATRVPRVTAPARVSRRYAMSSSASI